MVGEQVVDGDDVEVDVKQPLRRRVRCTTSRGRWTLPQIHTDSLFLQPQSLEHEDSFKPLLHHSNLRVEPWESKKADTFAFRSWGCQS